MTWNEALEIVVAHGGTERYRELTSDTNPDVDQRDGYRQIMVEKASRIDAGSSEYPPIIVQAGNALGAAVQAVASGFATVDQAEQERRLAICRDCEFFDAAQVRCRQCGCLLSWKSKLTSWHCPIGKW